MNSPTPLSYCPDLLHYSRRETREVMVGNVGIGGDKPDPRAVDDHLGHPRHRGLRGGGAGAGGGRLRNRPHHRADESLRREPGKHRPRGPRRGLQGAAGGGHPFQAGRRARSREVGGKSPRQSGQLRRQEEVRDPRIQRRPIRGGTGAHPRGVHAAGPALQGPRPRHAHRHQPRISIRPDHEPLRRHAARHGGKRAGVRPHRAGKRLSRAGVLDEGEQPEGDDRGLPPARRPPACRRARTGTIRSTSA